MSVKSFKGIVDSLIQEYNKAQTFQEKINIIEKKLLILVPEISGAFLNELAEKIKLGEYDNFVFKKYYSFLKFSLPKHENKKLYSFSQIDPNDLINIDIDKSEIKSENNAAKYMSLYEPKENFSIITEKILSFKNDNKDSFLKNMSEFLNEMDYVFCHDFSDEIFYPMTSFPIYSYNYLCWIFIKTIKKFGQKRKLNENEKTNLFFVEKIKVDEEENGQRGGNENAKTCENINVSDFYSDKNTLVEYKDDNEKIKNYNRLLYFLSLFSKTFKNLSLVDDKSNLTKIKIMIFYFHLFEMNRFSNDIFKCISKILKSIESPNISYDLLTDYKMYYLLGDKLIPIDSKNWNKIMPNDYIKIIIDDTEINVKIKNFNANISNYKGEAMKVCFDLKNQEDLSIYGLQNNNYIKFDNRIEQDCKKIIKKIIASDLYIESFLKYDKRFTDVSDKEEIFKSICKGENSNDIMEEMLENIILIPFPKGFSGFCLKELYSIFLSNNSYSNSDDKAFKIFPKINSSLNALFHEITHIISYTLYANIINIHGFNSLQRQSYDTIEDENEELKKIQDNFINKYKSVNYSSIENFADFGDVIEVTFYGIFLNEYRLYSGIYFLSEETYRNGNINSFREKFCSLFENKSIFSKNEIIDLFVNKNEKNVKTNEILALIKNNDLIKSLLRLFPEIDEIMNYYHYESGKARGSGKGYGISNYSFYSKRNKKDKLKLK